MLECILCITPKTANFVQHVRMNIWYWFPLAELNYIRLWKDVNFSDPSSYEVLKLRFCAVRRAKFVNIDFRQKTHKLNIPSRILSILQMYFPLPWSYFSILYYQRIVLGCVAPRGPRTLPLRHTHGDVEIKREGSLTKTEALRSMLVQAALSLSFVSYWACKVLPNLSINIKRKYCATLGRKTSVASH